jgi:hypothetical protein
MKRINISILVMAIIMVINFCFAVADYFTPIYGNTSVPNMIAWFYVVCSAVRDFVKDYNDNK